MRICVRPYQLMCILCEMGAAGKPEWKDKRLREIVDRMRERWNIPVCLECNTVFPYDFQNPGHKEDSPEGTLFNMRRDLDILRMLGLVPGSVRPAVDLFSLLVSKMPTAQGICGYGEATAPEWQGCAKADSGNYEKGRKMGLEQIFPGRTPTQLAAAKEESVRELQHLDKLKLRVGHLMCMACLVAEHKSPVPDDNLIEIFGIIRNNPDIPVHLTDGFCVACPPCRFYDAASGFCTGPGRIGSELRAKRKHLVILQKLGLTYEAVLPAREILHMVYTKITSTREVCGYGDGVCTGPEWSICGGPEGNPNYETGRKIILDILMRETAPCA